MLKFDVTLRGTIKKSGKPFESIFKQVSANNEKEAILRIESEYCFEDSVVSEYLVSISENQKN